MTTLVTCIKNIIACVISSSLVITGVTPVAAQTVTCASSDSALAISRDCTATRIGSTTVAYPRLAWQRLSSLPATPKFGSQEILGGDEVTNVANRAAKSLGLKSSDIANMVAAFPANVPYVFARYNPLDSSLRIDLFKLEKTLIGSNVSVGLYQAAFTPANGEMWKASRMYISKAKYISGTVPGVNPFSTFQAANSDAFNNISLAGAQVAIGHAMRAVGAPMGLFAVTQPRMSSTTTSSSGWFTKKTTVSIYGNAKPAWYIAQPLSTLNNAAKAPDAAFCVTNPATAVTNCPLEEIAVAGVSFEQVEGGNLDETENSWLLHQTSKTGLTFLAALVIGVIGSFALVGLLGAAGIAASTAAAGANGTILGSVGTFLGSQGIAITTVAGSLGVEAVGFTLSTALLGGANLNSTFNIGPEALVGYPKMQKGTADIPVLSEYQGKLNSDFLAPAMKESVAAGRSLTAVNKTVIGTCSLSKLAEGCESLGTIARPDNFIDDASVQFVRDNGGLLLK